MPHPIEWVYWFLILKSRKMFEVTKMNLVRNLLLKESTGVYSYVFFYYINYGNIFYEI